jgi:hypothetical protein
MKRSFKAVIVCSLGLALASCNKAPSTTSADSVNKPADAPANPVDQPKAAPQPEPAPKPVTLIPAGTTLRIVLIDAVSSDKNRAGDKFAASLAEPVVIDGKTVLSKGTKLRGRVVDAKESGRVKGRASIELKLTEIVFKDGKQMDIATKPYTAVAQSTTKRDAAIIGGGAGLGAVIGAIAGGGKGAAIGAGVGGGAGTGTVLATKGKEIRYAPETRLQFTLASPIEI